TLARIQRARHRDHGADWRIANTGSASLRSRSVSIVLHVSRRARRRCVGASQTLARTQLDRLLRHATTLLDLVRRKLPPSKAWRRSDLSNGDIPSLPAGPSRTRAVAARVSHARRRAVVISQSVRLFRDYVSPVESNASRLDGRVCNSYGAAL